MKHGFMWGLLIVAAWVCLAAGAIAAIDAAPATTSDYQRSVAMLDCISRGQPRSYCETLLFGPTRASWTLTIYYVLSGTLAALVFGGLASILGQVERLRYKLDPPPAEPAEAGPEASAGGAMT